MKMLYQNAVYKSLNLNLSQSNSSRSGSNSRDISLKSRESTSASKYTPGVSRVYDKSGNNIRFNINNTNLSSERKFKINNSKRNLLRDDSLKHASAKKGFENSIDKKKLSPDFRRAMKYNKEEQSEDKKLAGGKTHRSKHSDTLYLSYRRSSKSGLKNPGSSSKPRYNAIDYSIGTNDTFETKNKNMLKSGEKETGFPTPKPEFNPSNSHLPIVKKQSSNDEFSHTIDSARDSDLSYKSTSNVIREFMDAAANGNREKLERFLKSGKIPDINITDHNMKTALHYAVTEGRYKTL